MANMKAIYFAQRKPGLAEPFRPRWRRHAALGMSLPMWSMISRYAQYDPVGEVPAALGAVSRYDAIGSAWHAERDLSWMEDARQDILTMRQDETEVFDRIVQDTGLVYAETVLKDDGAGLFQVFLLVRRRAGQEISDLRAEARRYCDAILADPVLEPALARLALSFAEAGLEDPAHASHDAVIELSFHTLERMEAFFASEPYRALAKAYDLAEVERCVTREVLLYDVRTAN